MVGDVRRQMSLVGRLGDWMGTGGRRPGAGRGAQMAVLTRGCGTAPPAPTSAHSRYRRRAFPPDQRAGCLGRRKGASRPFGIGLRPTLPPTSGSRIGRVVGSAGECGRRGLSVGGPVWGRKLTPWDRRPDGGSLSVRGTGASELSLKAAFGTVRSWSPGGPAARGGRRCVVTPTTPGPLRPAGRPCSL